MNGSRFTIHSAAARRTGPGWLAALGGLWLLAPALAGCSSSDAEGMPPASVRGEGVTSPEVVATPASSASGDSASAPPGTSDTPAAEGEAVGTEAVLAAPALPAGSGAPSAEAAGAADEVTAAEPPASDEAEAAPITPPVSDTASPLPVARQGGFTTDANIIYGPLPEQRLDVLYPPNAGPNGTEKLPGVLMFHGGGWIQGDKATMASFYSRFLAHGFIVASVEYRVASQGIAPAAVEDALLAAKWFYDHADYYNVDKSKYIVTGASAGGHLALMVGMATAEAGLGPSHPKDFQIAAIVNGYGPADVTDMLDRRVGFALSWLPENTPDRAALAQRVSPVTYVRQDLPPLLTVQGSEDTTVPVAEGVELDRLLVAAGADAEHHLVAGAGHGFTTPGTAWPDAEKTIFGFLVKHGIGK